MYDLQQYDICREANKVQDSIIQAQRRKDELQQSTIIEYTQRDSIRLGQIQDYKTIGVKKDEIITTLQEDVSLYKKITSGTIIGAVILIILL